MRKDKKHNRNRQLIRDYKKGNSFVDLVAKYRITSSRIFAILKDYGVFRRSLVESKKSWRKTTVNEDKKEPVKVVFCSDCDRITPLSPRAIQFSQRRFERPLCYNCQKKVQPASSKGAR